MMAHELLRQAAQILGAGWSKGASARDATGRIVPLWAELLRQAAQILGAGWSKGSNARDDAGSIVPLHIGRQPGRHQSGRGGVLALWRDLQGRQSESRNPATAIPRKPALVMMLGASCRCTSGANRAAINPAAVAFSPYGATCKAASQNPGTRRRPFQESQRS